MLLFTLVFLVILLRWDLYSRGKLEKETNWGERLGIVNNLLRMAGGRGAEEPFVVTG